MKDIKKLLFAMTSGIIITTGIIVVASKQNPLTQYSFAEPSKDRELVLNSSTPLQVEDDIGRVTVGNMSVLSKNCSTIANGVGRIGYYGTIIYCNNATLLDSTYYQGFGSSSIASLSITLNSNNVPGNITIAWARLNASTNASKYYSSGSKTTISPIATNENQTFELLGNNSQFIAYQSTPKSSGYSCIYIGADSNSFNFDLISLTVEYSCN